MAFDGERDCDLAPDSTSTPSQIPWLRGRLCGLASACSRCVFFTKESDSLPLSSLSLCFEDKGIERGFLQSLSQRLVRADFSASIINMTLAGVILGIDSVSQGVSAREEYQGDEAHHIENLCFVFDVLLFLWALASAVIAWLQQRRGCVGAFAVEVCTTVALMLALLIGMLKDRWYMARFHGVADPAEIMHRNLDDTWLLLFVDLVITGTHIYLPVRWCTLWPVEVLAMMCYPCLVLFWGSQCDQGAAFNHSLQLGGLILFAALGKRHKETLERQMFYSLLSERTKRAEAEFQLQRAKSISRAPSSEDPEMLEVDLESNADLEGLTSKGTSMFFEDFDMINVESSLQRLAAVGVREHWLVDSGCLHLDPQRLLGHGGFGVVVEGTYHDSPVAIKVTRLATTMHEMRHLPALLNELRVLRQVRHPNIVIFHGALIDSSNRELALVLELVKGKTLKEFVETPGISDPDRYHVLLGMCRALLYLHGHRPTIVHGDLKPSNIIIQKSSIVSTAQVKLLDFGLARILSRRTRPLSGTFAWMAPEVINSEASSPGLVSPAADVFSFGRIMHFTVTGMPVLQGMKKTAILSMVRRGRRPEMQWVGASALLPVCKELVEPCTALRPEKRPVIATVHSSLTAWPGRLAPECLLEGPEQELPAMSDVYQPWDVGMRFIRGESPPLATGEGAGDADAAAQQQTEAAAASAEDTRQGSKQSDRQGSKHSGKSQSDGLMSSVSEPQPETPLITMAAMVFPAMERWVCGYPHATTCCAYHLAAKRLMHLAQKLSTAQCAVDFKPSPGPQCGKCFAIARLGTDVGEKCDVCGSELAAALSPARPKPAIQSSASLSLAMSL